MSPSVHGKSGSISAITIWADRTRSLVIVADGPTLCMPSELAGHRRTNATSIPEPPARRDQLRQPAVRDRRVVAGPRHGCHRKPHAGSHLTERRGLPLRFGKAGGFPPPQAGQLQQLCHQIRSFPERRKGLIRATAAEELPHGLETADHPTHPHIPSTATMLADLNGFIAEAPTRAPISKAAKSIQRHNSRKRSFCLKAQAKSSTPARSVKHASMTRRGEQRACTWRHQVRRAGHVSSGQQPGLVDTCGLETQALLRRVLLNCAEAPIHSQHSSCRETGGRRREVQHRGHRLLWQRIPMLRRSLD